MIGLDMMYPGSSPLTRGKLDSLAFGGITTGLIPAHAGKTSRALSALGNLGAHPRSRGENESRLTERLTRWGSSPLTRGKRRRAPARWLQVRLIPAHAGKTRQSLACPCCRQAHPRSRGEHDPLKDIPGVEEGSSPLTRGKLYGVGYGRRVHRLIPAHAGKTWVRTPTPQLRPAHPRSRGENVLSGAVVAAIIGSSPLTRGKRPTAPEIVVVTGLIPAHAGKTQRTSGELQTGTAHPRSRGENGVPSLIQ